MIDMFRSYDDIFEQRGLQYHKAMQSHPQARQAEFEELLRIAQLKANLTTADIPSGGGYLQQFLPVPLQLILIETCPTFAQANTAQKAVEPSSQSPSVQPESAQLATTSLLCKGLHHIPLPTGYLDRILSLAGLHHIEDRVPVYQEFYRLLSAGGLCCIAEVVAGSGVDRFLNEFVDRHSSLGHQGLFFENAEVDGLEKAGFKILSDRPHAYPWQFPSQLAMVQFCQDLFGIDQATHGEIFAGITQHLGYQVQAGHHQLQWELRFIQAQKS